MKSEIDDAAIELLKKQYQASMMMQSKSAMMFNAQPAVSTESPENRDLAEAIAKTIWLQRNEIVYVSEGDSYKYRLRKLEFTWNGTGNSIYATTADRRRCIIIPTALKAHLADVRKDYFEKIKHDDLLAIAALLGDETDGA